MWKCHSNMTFFGWIDCSIKSTRISQSDYIYYYLFNNWWPRPWRKGRRERVHSINFLLSSASYKYVHDEDKLVNIQRESILNKLPHFIAKWITVDVSSRICNLELVRLRCRRSVKIESQWSALNANLSFGKFTIENAKWHLVAPHRISTNIQ